MTPRTIGLGIIALLCSCATNNNNGTVKWQSFGFQPISQRPLRKTRLDKIQQPTLSTSKHRCTYYLAHSPMFNPEDEPSQSSSSSQSQSSPQSPSSSSSLWLSFDTALCIVPPEESWDTLQRARHFAQDPTYQQWPPAIRLFYPFVARSKLSNAALDVAAIVDRHQIKPFTVTLNQWTVMPLPDAYQTMLDENINQNNNNIRPQDDDSYIQEDPEFAKIQALIARETQLSRERKRKRDLKAQARQEKLLLEQQQQQQLIQHGKVSMNNNNATLPMGEAVAIQEQKSVVSSKKTARDKKKEKQIAAAALAKSNYDEFNGRAMIALEPDEKSRRKLSQLRELIRKELLEATDPNNPMTRLWDAPVPLYDTQGDNDNDDSNNNNISSMSNYYEDYVNDITNFRPLIPIGAFPTIDAALTMARKLKGLWDPLSFDVTELHFISQIQHSRQRLEESQAMVTDPKMQNIIKNNNNNNNKINNNNNNVMNLPDPLFVGSSFVNSRGQKIISESKSPFGCDAVVMLVGEEIEMDDESNALLANLVWERGTSGGALAGGGAGGGAGGDGTAQQNDNNNDNHNDDSEQQQQQQRQQEENGHNSANFLYSSTNPYGEFKRTLDIKEGDWEDLLDWLDGDDDEDQEMEIGTSVVIGRTHLFSGEKRIYTGMPASVMTEEADGSIFGGAGMGDWDDGDLYNLREDGNL